MLDAARLAGATLKDVTANGNGVRGIGVGASFDLSGVKITNVTAAGNGGGGISVFSGVEAHGAQISHVSVTDNGLIGLELLGADHVVKDVRADANGEGIRLDAPGGNNTIEKCSAHVNNGPPTGTGIKVENGNTGNVIQKNTALFNDGPDLEDDNPNCDANVWRKNVFLTPTAACIQ